MSRIRRLITAALIATPIFAVATPAVALMRPRPVPINPPVCPDPPAGYIYRWVDPIYRTVTEQIWVPEQTQLVEDWVQVSPNRIERIWRTITIPAHYETITRSELLAPGHWQLVYIGNPQPPVYPIQPLTVGVDGYSQSPAEDLSKFSGLSEWPADTSAH